MLQKKQKFDSYKKIYFSRNENVISLYIYIYYYNLILLHSFHMHSLLVLLEAMFIFNETKDKIKNINDRFIYTYIIFFLSFEFVCHHTMTSPETQYVNVTASL